MTPVSEAANVDAPFTSGFTPNLDANADAADALLLAAAAAAAAPLRPLIRGEPRDAGEFLSSAVG